jgi:hypothetical protein
MLRELTSVTDNLLVKNVLLILCLEQVFSIFVLHPISSHGNYSLTWSPGIFFYQFVGHFSSSSSLSSNGDIREFSFFLDSQAFCDIELT